MRVRAGALHGELARADYAWTGKTTGAFLAPGDVVRVLVASVDAAAKKITGSLDQEPEFQGAVLAVQNRTGRVLAMVGGRSFELSRFNRTTQAMRQLGSTFKPIVYATAIDRGFTPVEHPAGQPGVVVGRRRPAALRAAQLRQEVRGPDHAAARRSSSRATCRPCA